MFCSNCGNKLEVEDKFCDNCGTAVAGYVNVVKKINKNAPISNKQLSKDKIVNNAINEPLNQIQETTNESISKNKKPILIISIAILFLVIGLGIYTNSHNKQKALQDALITQQQKTNQLSNQLLNVQNQKLQSQQDEASRQQKDSQSVVNIVCDDGSGGSGTILSDDGIVLTNNHVIANAKNCMVTLPDPATGEPVSIYESKPFIVPDLSDKYDIAMLEIDGSYTDSDGKTWGDYPTTFPALNPPDCSNETSQLGDSIKIYGYPVTSGGYNLTITEGIISSFSDDGNILTSAKIDSGNSGGLAVDQKGCFVGIPSAVIKGKYQNLGVIIPGSVIKQFMEDVKSQ